MPFSGLCALIGLLVLAGLGLYATSSSSRLPLPPGPQATWFGKVELPRFQPWRTYAQWKNLYGDLVYIRIFGNPVLVLNSAQAISDLLEKRSANYSSRPIRTMVVDLIGWDWLFSSMQYGKTWKRHRNLFLKYFPMNNNAEYHPVQTLEAHTLLRNLMESPENFRGHARRAGAAVILSVTYGITVDEEVDSQGDNFVTLADKALAGLARAGIFGTYMVDYIPILKHIPPWFPGAAFRRQAKKWRESTDEMVNRPFEVVKQRMVSASAARPAAGTASSCVVAGELENLAMGGRGESEKIIRNVAATCYAAGADTVVSALSSLFLAIALNPEVQVKAQAQLDQVLGGRLPALTDRAQLPYIVSIAWIYPSFVAEMFEGLHMLRGKLLRWNPVTPLGLAHYVSEEDEYRGYRIPKGTTVLPNVWGILHDPAEYPNPLSFDPDRYEDSEGNIRKGINNLPDAAFGFGRRMCPGRNFAFDFLWIATASILSVFTISRAIDENGNDVKPEEKYTSNLLSHPGPFQCGIAPRSRDAIELISQTQPL
ncbi:hypothetical protein V5O48_001615 [Marasmius crinis-equi]|uniref:Cytochrome P450 n=1 Tax=Marasmius crinis-equi TaxID=585013 RepID=A0ABR3FXU5_9AGAR